MKDNILLTDLIMRLALYLTFLFVASSFFGCRNNAITEQPVTPDPATTPAIAQDENGNSINPDGWTLPVTTPVKKDKFTWIRKYQDGRNVKVNVLSYSVDKYSDKRVILEGPHRPGGNAIVLTRVDELSVRGGKIFCFIYSVSPFTKEGLGELIAVTSKYKFWDMDGDGKYELKGDGLGPVTVPNWAK